MSLYVRVYSFYETHCFSIYDLGCHVGNGTWIILDRFFSYLFRVRPGACSPPPDPVNAHGRRASGARRDFRGCALQERIAARGPHARRRWWIASDAPPPHIPPMDVCHSENDRPDPPQLTREI